jgi:hypothetical protein
MKFSLGNVFATAAMFALAVPSFAGTFTLVPSDKDLDDLDHFYAYAWGAAIDIPDGEFITGATLSIKNIWDWTKEDNDILNITLLDNPTLGIQKFYDNQGGGDYFAGQGVKVGSWTDPIGGYARNVNLTFDLGALGLLDEFIARAETGKVGFGFDPDCHYFNDGVKLTVHTAPVPEPATIIALGAGALALRLRRRKA